MQLDAPIRRGRRLSLTSLIDVIFLLLLFFMLSSTFTRFAEVEIKTAQSGVSRSVNKPDVFVTLSKQAWRINGVEIENQSITEVLASYRKKEASLAVIKVEEGLNSQSLLNALQSLRAAGFKVSVVK